MCNSSWQKPCRHTDACSGTQCDKGVYFKNDIHAAVTTPSRFMAATKIPKTTADMLKLLLVPLQMGDAMAGMRQRGA